MSANYLKALNRHTARILNDSREPWSLLVLSKSVYFEPNVMARRWSHAWKKNMRKNARRTSEGHIT